MRGDLCLASSWVLLIGLLLLLPLRTAGVSTTLSPSNTRSETMSLSASNTRPSPSATASITSSVSPTMSLQNSNGALNGTASLSCTHSFSTSRGSVSKEPGSATVSASNAGTSTTDSTSMTSSDTRSLSSTQTSVTRLVSHSSTLSPTRSVSPTLSRTLSASPSPDARSQSVSGSALASLSTSASGRTLSSFSRSTSLSPEARSQSASASVSSSRSASSSWSTSASGYTLSSLSRTTSLSPELPSQSASASVSSSRSASSSWSTSASGYTLSSLSSSTSRTSVTAQPNETFSSSASISTTAEHPSASTTSTESFSHSTSTTDTATDTGSASVSATTMPSGSTSTTQSTSLVATATTSSSLTRSSSATDMVSLSQSGTVSRSVWSPSLSKTRSPSRTVSPSLSTSPSTSVSISPSISERTLSEDPSTTTSRTRQVFSRSSRTTSQDMSETCTASLTISGPSASATAAASDTTSPSPSTSPTRTSPSIRHGTVSLSITRSLSDTSTPSEDASKTMTASVSPTPTRSPSLSLTSSATISSTASSSISGSSQVTASPSLNRTSDTDSLSLSGLGDSVTVSANATQTASATLTAMASASPSSTNSSTLTLSVSGTSRTISSDVPTQSVTATPTSMASMSPSSSITATRTVSYSTIATASGTRGSKTLTKSHTTSVSGTGSLSVRSSKTGSASLSITHSKSRRTTSLSRTFSRATTVTITPRRTISLYATLSTITVSATQSKGDVGARGVSVSVARLSTTTSRSMARTLTRSASITRTASNSRSKTRSISLSHPSKSRSRQRSNSTSHTTSETIVPPFVFKGTLQPDVAAASQVTMTTATAATALLLSASAIGTATMQAALSQASCRFREGEVVVLADASDNPALYLISPFFGDSVVMILGNFAIASTFLLLHLAVSLAVHQWRRGRGDNGADDDVDLNSSMVLARFPHFSIVLAHMCVQGMQLGGWQLIWDAINDRGTRNTRLNAEIRSPAACLLVGMIGLALSTIPTIVTVKLRALLLVGTIASGPAESCIGQFSGIGVPLRMEPLLIAPTAARVWAWLLRNGGPAAVWSPASYLRRYGTVFNSFSARPFLGPWLLTETWAVSLLVTLVSAADPPSSHFAVCNALMIVCAVMLMAHVGALMWLRPFRLPWKNPLKALCVIVLAMGCLLVAPVVRESLEAAHVSTFQSVVDILQAVLVISLGVYELLIYIALDRGRADTDVDALDDAKRKEIEAYEMAVVNQHAALHLSDGYSAQDDDANLLAISIEELDGTTAGAATMQRLTPQQLELQRSLSGGFSDKSFGQAPSGSYRPTSPLEDVGSRRTSPQPQPNPPSVYVRNSPPPQKISPSSTGADDELRFADTVAQLPLELQRISSGGFGGAARAPYMMAQEGGGYSGFDVSHKADQRPPLRSLPPTRYAAGGDGGPPSGPNPTRPPSLHDRRPASFSSSNSDSASSTSSLSSTVSDDSDL